MGATIIIPNGANSGSSAASTLKDATGVVDVSAATAPSAGQVLTATDATHATWQAAAGGAPTGAAGGDLGGTYPNPTVAKAAALKSATTTVDVSSATAPTATQFLRATGASAATWQTLSVVNADVSTTAAIAVSKLADNAAMGSSMPTADLQGWLSSAYDPIMASGSTSVITNGQLITVMIPWPYSGKAIANVDYAISTAAITPVAGQNFVAIYGPAGGAALGSLASDTAYTGTGLKTAAIAVSAGALPATGPGAYIYVAFLSNSATVPIMNRLTNGPAAGVVNAQNRASSSPRFGTFGSAQTTLPSLTVASIAGAGIGLSVWAAVR